MSLRVPVQLNIETAEPSGDGWSNKKRQIINAYGSVVRSGAEVSVVGDQIESVRTLTVKVRYAPEVFSAKSATIGDAVYRIVNFYDPDYRNNWIEMTLVELRK